jgi:N-acetylglucosamine kinase-like BadF-type ATPase
MKLYLGVDGGQSSTTALVGDENGRVTGMGRGGPCNHAGGAEAREKFVGAIRACVREALNGADAQFECASFGFSGGPEDKDALAREIVRAAKYVFAHDALIALTGATAGEPGIVAIAGTGSIAYGRNPEGRVARAGGWGFVFGDEGSAFDIVRQSLRAALRFEEGWGPRTALRDVLLEATGAWNVNDLLHRFYTDAFPRTRVASLAKLIEETAGAGDAVARDLLNAAAQSLATFASAVRGQLFRPGEIACVSYIGGVFRSGIVLDRFKALMELDEANRVDAPKFGPAAGALMEAYRAAGISVTLQGALPEKDSSGV